MRTTSLMSMWIMAVTTVGVRVTMLWKRIVPMITLGIDALLTAAPPIRIADTVGSVMLLGAMYSCMKPNPC